MKNKGSFTFLTVIIILINFTFLTVILILIYSKQTCRMHKLDCQIIFTVTKL